MQQLMKDVAEDITNCGNICDAYTKKSLVGECKQPSADATKTVAD
jgi:hypothetical protein